LDPRRLRRSVLESRRRRRAAALGLTDLIAAGSATAIAIIAETNGVTPPM
jgi:hypothetical protein